jgi:hypothetical protein
MCILEETAIVNYKEYVKLSNSCKGNQIVEYLSKEVTIPKLLSIRKLNPMPFLEDLKFLLSELQLEVPEYELIQIISLYLSGQNACHIGLKNLKMDRSFYLKICIIIKKRLKIFNNYLIDTLIDRRMQGWLEKNEEDILKAIISLKNSNNYVENSYLDHVNSVTEEKVKTYFRMRKNKVPLCRLGKEKFYLSKYLMTSVGAINWFKKTTDGKIKQKCLDQLKDISIKGYLNDINSFILYETTPVEEFVNDIYKCSQKIVDRQKADILRNQRFFDNRTRLIKENKKMKSENFRMKNIKYFKEKYGNVRLMGTMKKASESVTRFLRKKHGEVFKISEDEEILFSQLSLSPCQNKYYLFWMTWEHHYSKRGEFEMKFAWKMRTRRLELAKINYYPGFIEIPFFELDSLMYDYREKSPYYRLPEEVKYKNLFTINNNYYPDKSKFVGHLVLQNIKSGNYINVLQLYKNNAIEQRVFVTALSIQKLIRYLCKSRNIEVLDKHQTVSTLSNNILQMKFIKSLHNYNFMKMNNLITEIFEDYKRSRTFIHQRDHYFCNRSYIEENIEEFDRKFARQKVGTSTYKKKFKAYKNSLKRETETMSFKKAIVALDELETKNLSLQFYYNYGSLIRDFFFEISMDSPGCDLEEELDKEFSVKMQNHINPVITIFTNRVINMLINFFKVYKITKSHDNIEIRRASKPFRELEEALILRYRQLWDIRETGKIYNHINVEEYENWSLKEAIFKDLSKDIKFEDYTGEQISGALKRFRESRKNEEGNLVDKYSKDLDIVNVVDLIKIFKYKVSKELSVSDYLYNKTEIEDINKDPRTEDLEIVFANKEHDSYRHLNYAQWENYE